MGNCALNESCDPDLIDEIKELRIIIAETSENMKAEYIQKKNDNIHPPIITPNEKVMMRRSALDPGINRKMQEIRSGPWLVTKVVNSEITISLLEHPSTTRIRHISHLAPFIDRPDHLVKPLITTPIPTNFFKVDPSIIMGDFSSPGFLKPNSIVLVATECILRKASGLAGVLFRTFPYSSIYSGLSLIDKPDNQTLLAEMRKRPSARREPGTCKLKSPTTRKPGPTVANLTIQYCPGRPVNNNGVQNLYLEEHGEHLDNKTRKLIQNDTSQAREKWFREALSDLRTQLFAEGTPPSNIYIPKNIACGFSAGEHNTTLTKKLLQISPIL